MAVKFVVTHGYVRYGRHHGLPRDGECELCNVAEILIFEHCHMHGWIRGMACQRCNSHLRAAEAGTRITLRQANHLANCLDCPRAAAWMAGARPVPIPPPIPPVEDAGTRCPAGCSGGLLYLRSLCRLVPCPACKNRGDCQ